VETEDLPSFIMSSFHICPRFSGNQLLETPNCTRPKCLEFAGQIGMRHGGFQGGGLQRVRGATGGRHWLIPDLLGHGLKNLGGNGE